jgi:aryl-alcohol dehydrogenase
MTSPGRTHALSITAAIANAPQDPFEIATCELGDPQHGEVLVRVHACGICHTDMAVKLQHGTARGGNDDYSNVSIGSHSRN